MGAPIPQPSIPASEQCGSANAPARAPDSDGIQLPVRRRGPQRSCADPPVRPGWSAAWCWSFPPLYCTGSIHRVK
jgi:hypothetical protein